MRLSDEQRLFTQLIGKLIDYAYKKGYALTVGDAYRDPRVFGMVGVQRGYGRAESNHKSRLAMDFNLFIKEGDRWEYQTESEAFRPLGEYWESLHELCEWGGSNGRGDGNHFSMNYNGKW